MYFAKLRHFMSFDLLRSDVAASTVNQIILQFFALRFPDSAIHPIAGMQPAFFFKILVFSDGF